MRLRPNAALCTFPSIKTPAFSALVTVFILFTF
jgi:hypothetical protein